MPFRFYSPKEEIPTHIIFPKQTHSSNIQEIISLNQDLSNTDGIWTKSKNLKLGIKTADCASIVFLDKRKIGIVHAGWRGLSGDIIEKMLKIFSEKTSRRIWVGPFLHQFEIQQDFCFKEIKKKFSQNFFNLRQGKIFFDFLGALSFVLPPETIFSPQNTSKEKILASHRRGDKTRNITTVWFDK